MHILHLIPDLGFGGAQRMLAYTAAATDLRRYRFSVAYWGEMNALQGDLERLGVTVIPLQVSAISLPRIAACVAQTLRRLRPDVVHTHLFDADLVGVLSARALGVRRCCSSVHGFSFFTTALHRWRYRWVLGPLVSRFFPVSRALGTFLVQQCGLPAARVRVIVNGIDLTRFGRADVPDPRPTPGPVIGTLSRLVPQKGIQYVIQAFAQVQSDFPEARLVIGGGGEARDALEQQVRSLGLTQQVVFAGAVRNPTTFLQQLDLFIFPSLDEAFGLVLLEAMASGLPVIATCVGGIPEILEPERGGLLVPPADSHAIAEGIRSIWKEPNRRSRMRETARQNGSRFSIARTAADLQAAYEELA